MNEQQLTVLRQALRDLILEYCMERSSFAKRVDEIFKQALAQPAVSQCLWARNGNTPCPHTKPAAWVGLTETQKVELARNWFAEDWAITNAVGMLHDYDAKLREKNGGGK